MRLNQVTLPALDVEASVAFYREMGFEQIVSSAHYARFKAVDGDATFSVHLVAALAASPATVVYFETPALDETVHRLKQRGLVFFEEATDKPWLWREARLADPAGNTICLYWAGENRLSPPWRIKP